jgi:hypothetical protein
MTEPKSIKVFLSYSSEDRASARLMAELLTSSGVSVWFDEQSLVPGASWEREISSSIDSADVI